MSSRRHNGQKAKERWFGVGSGNERDAIRGFCRVKNGRFENGPGSGDGGEEEEAGRGSGGGKTEHSARATAKNAAENLVKLCSTTNDM